VTSIVDHAMTWIRSQVVESFYISIHVGLELESEDKKNMRAEEYEMHIANAMNIRSHLKGWSKDANSSTRCSRRYLVIDERRISLRA